MTVRAALDSNVLIYSALEPGSEKGKRARNLIQRASVRGVLAAQALLEFVAVVRRRAPHLAEHAIAQTSAWATVFEVAPTSGNVTVSALALVKEHRFQVWDAVIWSASREAGATLLFTEDLQNGLTLRGMKAVNPFGLTQADLNAVLPG